MIQVLRRKKMERRNFIVLAAVGAAAVAAPIWYYNSIDYDKSLTKLLLLSNIWDIETIKEIGQLYQKKYPNENNETKLVKLLSESISTENGSTESSIAWRIKEDFKTNSIVTIDGWLLSVTEGRQCALYSLMQLK